MPENHPFLKPGATGEDVKVLQSLLRKSGFFDGALGGNFKTLTTKAVKSFQQTHLGPDGKWLEVDGKVGPATWWALYNPNGSAQRSNLKTDFNVIPAGISEIRRKLLEVAISQHKAGVAESPMGSNWGDGVTKFLQGVGPCAWCCYCVSWLVHEATGKYPMGERHGHCATMWREAKERGLAFTKAKYTPIPGDIFLMLYGTSGSGHTGLVSNVSSDGTKFNTLEGNAGDRFKHGVREMSQSTLVGFINLFGDNTPEGHKFTRQLVTTAKLDSSLASTR